MTTFGRLADLDDDALRAAYAPVREPWLRLNFVATVDGAAQGADGTSRSINNSADGRVFGALREQADVIIAGAGTVRVEGYRPNPKPLVVVTRSGEVPPTLLEGDTSRVYVATGSAAPGLERARSLLGERVLVLGSLEPDLVALRRELEGVGFSNLLCEGGPHLAANLLAAGVVDELCSTVVPALVGGSHLRMVEGLHLESPAIGPARGPAGGPAAGPGGGSGGVPAAGPGGVRLRLHALLESDSTLLARWLVLDG